MTLTDAQQLIAQGEGHQIEFKLKAKHPDRIIREIVAFSNSKGGHLFIGVDDDGSIIADSKMLKKPIMSWKKRCRSYVGLKLNMNTRSYP